MNGALAEPLVWSGRKRWLVIAGAVAVQAGLILWFSARTLRPVRVVDARPAVQLVAPGHSELLAVTDPTLFCRAHPKGFSGPAWLGVPAPPEPEKFPESSTTPLWLAVVPENLGGMLHEFVQQQNGGSFTLRNWPPPAITQPSSPPILTTVTGSVVQVEGALAVRGLLDLAPLPAWPNADILAPSQVEVLVDARGNPLSALLLTSSGLKAADQAAVNLARTAQFGSDRSALNTAPGDPAAGLVSGRLIFRWHTLPVVALTNDLPNPR